MIGIEEIKQRLWDGANELRGSMDASRYKDYMLGLMFYKFLSDKTLESFNSLDGNKNITEFEIFENYIKAKEKYKETIEKRIQTMLGYYVSPEYLYQSWIKDINSGDFELQKVADSLNNFERTIAVNEDSDDFKGLFSGSTLDLTDTALGSNLNERSKNIKALILLFADLNMVDLQKGDILGDAYEYLIGQFAMESGKKAGEFYTPRQVSEVMAQIAAKTSNIRSIYDATVGSGSLLLTVRKHLDNDTQQNLNYYGQEKNTATYNLTRMNLLLHGVKPNKMTIKNGDTLSQDWPEDPEHPNEGVQFDAVVMNPPYSLKKWNKSGLKVNDPRFEMVGVLPPDSKGDYAFLLHGLYHLAQNGTMAIVLPHGVLFRSGTEGEIRKRLLEKNNIDAIIGLPANLFTNTGIPVLVMILKKNRSINDPVLIIDSSKNFIKVGKQNVLQEKDIAKIVDTYVDRKEEKGYSHLASRNEIIENEYNLNIPRYVEVLNEEIPHDVDAHLFGGIPYKNISDLKIIQTLVPDIINNSMKEIRESYVELTKSIDDLTLEILNDSRITHKTESISKETHLYIQKYWEKIKKLSLDSNSNQLREEMLYEIKNMLSNFDFIDVYDGYQNIVEIWNHSLRHDAELISQEGFYNVAKTREPNMVIKGSGNNKRKEQDGWVGRIVPNELIEKNLYSNELKEIANKNYQIQEIDEELLELLDAAKVEDSEEANILDDTLNEEKEAFVPKEIKNKLKKSQKNSDEYLLLKKIDDLFTNKSNLSKEIKNDEKELKENVQNRILVLTNDEIDQLMFEKWFKNVEKNMVNLVEMPIKKELDTLKMINERYSETLSDIEDECAKLEKQLQEMMKELVVL